MGIPIDEMLTDLRTALETFEANPSHESFDAIQRETMRIEHECEKTLPDDE